MRRFYKASRLYVDASLQTGADLVLTKPQMHHLIHVLRLRVGAQILLFNGREGEWLAQLVEIDKKILRVRVECQTKQQPLARDLVYCFAPLKSARLDYMVQKATEMGAGQLQPVMTQFTQATHVNLERMQTNIVEAAQQCGLLNLPSLLPPLKLVDLLESWDRDRHLVFCDEMLAEEEGDAIITLAQLVPAPVALLIGPEGGFSDTERDILRALPFVTAIGLGKRILRSDTAAVAAMALINAIFEN